MVSSASDAVRDFLLFLATKLHRVEYIFFFFFLRKQMR